MGFLANFLPRWCVCCGSYGADFCPNCYDKLTFLPSSSFELDVTSSCVDQAWAVCPFSGVAKELVVGLKYRLYRIAALAIGELMYQHLSPPMECECLVPIPLHRLRFLERGFNQAELIAQYLSQWWGIPTQQVLAKSKGTLRQAELAREQRLHNIAEVFYCPKPPSFHSVCLIDDVSTTGTTLNEAAKVLKSNGVSTVYACVFAHGK